MCICVLAHVLEYIIPNFIFEEEILLL